MTFDEVWHLLSPFVVGSLLFMGYGLVLRRVAVLAQPDRLSLAACGQRLLGSGTLTEEERRAVRFSLDRAFSALPAFVAVFFIPCALLVIAARFVVGRPPTGVEASPDMKEFLKLSLFSFVAANPVCGGLALLEFLLVGFFVSLIAGHRTLSHAVRSLLRVEAMAARMSRHDTARTIHAE